MKRSSGIINKGFAELPGILLLTSMSLCTTSCAERELKSKISELGRELDRKEVYEERFNARMDSLKLCLESDGASDSLRWETAYSIFSAYSYVNVDSTLHYLDVLSGYASTPELKNRSEACRIRSFGVEQDYESLFEALSEIDPEKVSESFRQRYFTELQRACVLCPGNVTLKKTILRKALEFDGLDHDVRMRYEGLTLLYDDRYPEALPYFEEAYRSASNDHIKALAAYNQAVCYRHLGDAGRHCLWLAEAAIHDIRVPVSDYSSLWKLSDALFERGDYSDASRCIQIVMGDAIEGNWNSRIQLSAASQSSIFNALDKSHSQLVHLMMASIIFLIVSVALVLSLLYFTFRQNRNLLALNDKVTDMNSRLKDEGKIKENYLFRYMEMAVNGMGRLEDYRHQMRQILKEEGAESLAAMLRSPRPLADYKEFYSNFDKTFLSLYPDFIRQVNGLMKEGHGFRDDGVMNTDLRILATIRLGFNDSGQIARFLNVPSTSVYTRRSALRRNSVCNKEEFEKEIRHIT